MSVTYITGHKNPDTDSICSSIVLANLENTLGIEAIACRQGPLNEETKFVLRRFHQENPFLLTDARLTLGEIELDEPTIINQDDTIQDAWKAMISKEYKSLVVVDDNNKLVGVCTAGNLGQYRLLTDDEKRKLMSSASLEHINRVLMGSIVADCEDFNNNGVVHVITLEEQEAKEYDLSNGISILSSGTDKQTMLLNEGVNCLIITCGVHVEDSVIELAKKKGCAIIETPLDTMHAAQAVTEAYSIKEVMSKDVIFFRTNEYTDDVSKQITKSRLRSFPVLDEDDNIVGSVTRYRVQNYTPRRVILVDHSAINQTLNNINDARIVAIIDHHHIGGIQTDYPIYYRNEKIGCTCTILAKMYQENGIEPTEDMAGLMLSAIISDTLNFKSTTTTDEDIEIGKWLAEKAGITDIDEYAREMLGASVALLDSTPSEILNRDLKSYEIGEYKFAIGQTNYARMDEVQKILPQMREELRKQQEANGLDLMVMLFTDVMGEGSYFIYEGPLSNIMNEVLETIIDNHSGYDTTIISRKQQLMPKLSQLIKQL